MQSFEADTEKDVGQAAVHDRSPSTLGDGEYYGRYLLHIVLHLQQLGRISLYLLPLEHVVIHEVFPLTMLHLPLADHFWFVFFLS